MCVLDFVFQIWVAVSVQSLVRQSYTNPKPLHIPEILQSLCQMGVAVVCYAGPSEVLSRYLSKWAAGILDLNSVAEPCNPDWRIRSIVIPVHYCIPADLLERHQRIVWRSHLNWP